MSRGEQHVPTDELKSLVSSYKASGATDEIIAQILRIDQETLVKYYTLELTIAKDVMTQRVYGKLAEKIEAGSEPAIFFYLARRGGWKSADKQLEVDAAKEIAAAQLAADQDSKLNALSTDLRGHLRRDESVVAELAESSTETKDDEGE